MVTAYVGRHRQPVLERRNLHPLNVNADPRRDRRPDESLTTDQIAHIAMHLLTASEDRDVESISVSYGGSAYAVRPVVYVNSNR